MILNKILLLLLLQFLQGIIPGYGSTGCRQAVDICPESKYRSYNGSCNNLKNPEWGTAQTGYNRMLPAKYGDGISLPTVAQSGNNLPSARAVSASVYPDVPLENLIWTLNAMQYGQVIAHDMSLASGGAQSNDCCSADGQFVDASFNPELCFPIVVPVDDPDYSQQNIRCMNFTRTLTDRDRGCVRGNQTAEQLNGASHFLDLSIVYGSSDQNNQQIRTFQGGRLISEKRNNQDWLPRNVNSSSICTLVNPNEPCYRAGDVRVNQNPQLTVLQTLFLREHNRIADTLTELNPHWDDETVFQEARKINIAQHQHITYYEWIPIFLGADNAQSNKLIWDTDGWVNDYDPTVDPSVLNEHTTAAYRYFHTMIAGQLNIVSELRISYENARLSDWFNRPGILEQDKYFDGLTRGLATQSELDADAYHDSEITLNWARQPGKPLGLDLKAICIQRNRDHGLASYNDFRSACGLPRARTFQDFSDVMSQSDVDKLAALYEHPDDVDLTVGGSLESLAPGALAGPTFLCIITEQFYRTRVGDRFWFENSGDVGFTKPQLKEIRKSSIARIMCDNSLDIIAMQPKAFRKISLLNPAVPCILLPSVDLSLWKE